MTQIEIEKEVMVWKEMSIKKVALKPNIGSVYTISINRVDKIILSNSDSIKWVKKLKELWLKFDMVFLDIPYNTPAVKWWNRGIKYDTISTDQFKELLLWIKDIIKEEWHLYYMFSNAPSGWKQMVKYNKVLDEVWFNLQMEWGWQKIYKNWNKCVNPRWNIMKKEWLNLYSISKEIDKTNIIVDFEEVRPRTASEKPLSMMRQLISQSTKLWEMVLDTFSWTWVMWEAAILEDRKAYLFEKSEDRVKKEIIPRLTNLFY